MATLRGHSQTLSSQIFCVIFLPALHQKFLWKESGFDISEVGVLKLFSFILTVKCVTYIVDEVLMLSCKWLKRKLLQVF